MLCLNDELLFKLNLGYVSALVLQHTAIVLLLADSFRGQSQGARPSRTIVTLVGEDVILPCHLEPAVDVVSKSVEWGRLDLEPRFVHVWHEGQNILSNQNPSYKGRTSVSIEKLKHGDLSLTLSAAKLSDNGIYRCYFPSQSKESTVELIVDTKMNRDAERAKTEREQLMAERKKMEDLEEKKAKLAEMLQKNEEEEKDLEQVVKTLMEQEEQLKEQRDQTEHQKNHMETNITDIEIKLQSVEKMAESDRYHEMKSIVLTAKNQLKGRKQEDEKLHVETQRLLTKTQSVINRMTDRKKAAENYKETLSEQLEEIEKQKEEIQSRL